jgi:CheY-like chemotaxis protein
MKPLRVLVVDDDALVGELLAEMLDGMGYEICAVEATEADTVAAAFRCKPDLMIVDIHLGNGSGITAVEQIYRIWPIPHIFISGDSSTVQQLKPTEVVLQKPFLEAELARAIRRALAPPAVP